MTTSPSLAFKKVTQLESDLNEGSDPHRTVELIADLRDIAISNVRLAPKVVKILAKGFADFGWERIACVRSATLCSIAFQHEAVLEPVLKHLGGQLGSGQIDQISIAAEKLTSLAQKYPARAAAIETMLQTAYDGGLIGVKSYARGSALNNVAQALQKVKAPEPQNF